MNEAISRYIAKHKPLFQYLFVGDAYRDFINKLESGKAPNTFERGIINHIEQQVGEPWPTDTLSTSSLFR